MAVRSFSVSACLRAATRAAIGVAVLAASGCGTLDAVGFGGASPAEGTAGHVSGFLGAAVADEPQAALVARNILSAGGNAADAAVAAAFTLAVTLPSRASLGSGGACIAYAAAGDGPGRGVPEAVMFPLPAPAAPNAQGVEADRPAGVPMLPRGLFALHARYGHLPFEQLVSPAERFARFGVPASRALVRDIAVVAGPLAGDPAAAAVFLAHGQPLAEGAPLRQPELATTLAQLRTAGVGDLYQGALARRFADAATQAGGGIAATDLRGALPRIVPPLTFEAGNDLVSLPPLPIDGGVAMAAAVAALRKAPDGFDAAQAAAMDAAGRARGGPLPAVLPASTTLLTLDRDGGAVACALTMDNLFGTGRIAPGTGVVLAASPAAFPQPLLAVAIVSNANVHRFRAAVGGSGQSGAALAGAVALVRAVGDDGLVAHPMPAPVPEPGRANVIQCNRRVPGAESSCGWATDPRGAGLALGSAAP